MPEHTPTADRAPDTAPRARARPGFRSVLLFTALLLAGAGAQGTAVALGLGVRPPDPVWPVLLLAAACLVDGLLCLRPPRFIRHCLRDVRWPESRWWVFPPVKLAAAAGLVGGLWWPGLGLATAAALVVYFVLAVAAHVRVGDIGRTLLVNTTGLLLCCCGVLAWCFG